MASLSAASRPLLGFGLVLLLVLGLAVVANRIVQTIRQAEQQFTGDVLDEIIAIEQLAGAVEGRAAARTAFALTGDHTFLQSVGQARADFDAAVSELEASMKAPGARQQLQEIVALDRRLREEGDRLTPLVDEGQDRKARLHFVTSVGPLQVAVMSRLNELRRSTRERTRVAQGVFAAHVAHQSSLLALSSIAALLLAGGIIAAVAYRGFRFERRLNEVADQATANERSLSALLSASPDLIFQVDREHRILFASLSSLKATGQSVSLLRGVRLTELDFLHDTRAPLASALKQVLQEGTNRRLEGWCHGTRGPRYLEFALSPIYEEGRIEAVVVTGRDLTERLQMEAELRESNIRVGSILESITDAFVSLDAAWRFTYVNREAERLFGIPRAQLEGRSMWDAFPQTVGSDLERRYRAAIATQQPAHLEEFFGPMGKWLELHAYPSSYGLSVYFRDITTRKRAEHGDRLLTEAGAQLAESLDFEATLDRMVALLVPELAHVSALWLVEGESLRFVAHDVEPEGEALLYRLSAEYPLDSHEPRGVGSVLRTGEPVLLQKIDADLLAGAARSIEHLRLLRELRLTSLLAVPIRGRDGLVGVLAIGSRDRDRPLDEGDLRIVEQFALRAALAIDNARLYRDATLAAQAREELLAIVSHDLKNPVHQIQLISKTILRTRAEQLEADLKEKMEAVARASDRMRRLISDLLDLASVQSRRLSLQRDAWSTELLLEDAREALEPLTQERGLRLVLQNDAPGRRIDCDRSRVVQILANLVGNAIRYSPEGGEITVRAEALPDLRRIRLCVADQGPGIPPEVMPHLFERFWSGGSAHEGGSGLGLYIVKGIVESHGGRVWATNDPEGGARLILELPEASTVPDEVTAGEAPPAPPH